MRGIQKKLLLSSGRARLQLALTVALGLAATALIVAQACLLARAISSGFIDGADAAALSGTLIALAAVAIGRGLVGFGFDWTGRLAAAAILSDLRGRLVRKLLGDRPADASAPASGELAAAGVQGIEALEAFYARYLPQMVLAAIAPIAILAWVFPRDMAAGIVLAVTFPLIPVFMVLVGMLAERSMKKRWQALSMLSGRFVDLVSGLQTLRAFGRAEGQAGTIAAASEAYRRETMATLRVAFLSALVLELLAMIGTAIVAATVGRQLAHGALELEQGLIVLLLAPEIYMPLRQAGAQFHASTDGIAAAEAIFEVLDRPAAIEVPDQPLPAPDPRHAAIELTGVGVTHPGRDGPALAGIDLVLEPGRTYALTGPSGAGKSTLASLLLRLADPTVGEVRCGGVDLRRTDPADWRRHVAWVPQRPTIFAGTIAENVALGCPGMAPERIEAVLADAGGGDLLADLPDGLETRVGEGGRPLSAGQAQRVALARALARESSLVVLDEPSSHLDGETISRMLPGIERLLDGRTALVITHGEQLLELADEEVGLAGGRLAALPRACPSAAVPA